MARILQQSFGKTLPNIHTRTHTHAQKHLYSNVSLQRSISYANCVYVSLMTHLLNLVDALIYSIHHLNDTLTCFGTPSFTCHYQLQIGWHYDYVQELRCWFSVVWLSCAKYRIYCAMVKDYYCFGTSVRSYFIGFGFYRSMINDKLTSMSI